MEEAKVGVDTHALHYGTGVFEGIRGNWNAEKETLYVFRLREHYERMTQGCRLLMIDIPYSVDDLCDITIELIRRCGYKQDIYIRPLAYKSARLIANLKLHELDSDFCLMTIPFGDYLETGRPAVLHLHLASSRRPLHSAPLQDDRRVHQQHPGQDGGGAGGIRRGHPA